MKLWLVGGDDRQIAVLAEHFRKDAFTVEQWRAKGQRGHVHPAAAPKGATHVMLLNAHCYNVMAESARKEARRLDLPFVSVPSNAVMVEALAKWGFPRVLREARRGELQALIAQNWQRDLYVYGSLPERNGEVARLTNLAAEAGLSSTHDSVRTALNRMARQERERDFQRKREEARIKAMEAAEKAAEEESQRLIAEQKRLAAEEKASEAPSVPQDGLSLSQAILRLELAIDALRKAQKLEAMEKALAAITAERDEALEKLVDLDERFQKLRKLVEVAP